MHGLMREGRRKPVLYSTHCAVGLWRGPHIRRNGIAPYALANGVQARSCSARNDALPILLRATLIEDFATVGTA